MDFINSHDWLNRPGPNYAFKLDHILFVVVSMLIGAGLCFLLRKKSQKIIKTVLISLWAFGAVAVFVYYLATYIQCAVDPENHPFIMEKMLPFHSCLAFIYVFPFAIFSKNRIIKLCASNFLVIINMIIGFITLFVGCPPVGDSTLSFPGLQSLIIHVIIVIVPLIMVTTKYYDLQIRDIKYGLILFGILALVMWIFDACSGCDYFYHYDGHTFPVLKVISENVHHLVWTLIVVSCYVITGFAIHFLIVGFKYFVDKKRSPTSSDPQTKSE